MDKKKIGVVIIGLVIIGVAGFLAYKYLSLPGIRNQNLTGGPAQTSSETPVASPQNSGNMVTPLPSLSVEANGSGGIFTICSDKCGDGICQKKDPECKDNMNCICPETKDDCPQDCK